MQENGIQDGDDDDDDFEDFGGFEVGMTGNRPHNGDQHSGSVVERPLCDWEVSGPIPSWVIPNTLKMVLAVKKCTFSKSIIPYNWKYSFSVA